MSEGSSRWSQLPDWAKPGMAVVVIYLFLRTFVLQGLVVTSDSMEPNLLAGDVILVDRAAVGVHIPLLRVRTPGYSTPARFDVLAFDVAPGSPQGAVVVKRLVGVPGDTLSMRNAILHINGDPVAESHATLPSDPDVSVPQMSWQVSHVTTDVEPTAYFPTRDNWGPLVVPPREYFFLGDHRATSVDSRHYGFVESRRVKGRATLIMVSYDPSVHGVRRTVRSLHWQRSGRIPK